MLDPELHAAYLRQGKLVLCHVTPAENVDGILRDGLRPGSDVGKKTRSDFFEPRSGRVYLIRPQDVPIVEVNGEPRVFSVQFEALNPDLIDPDEDIVADCLQGLVAVPSPVCEFDEDGRALPGQEGSRARWADETDGFDRSEVTERCLFDHGRVSYRGSVPPSAVSLLDIRSQPLSIFAQSVPQEIRDALSDVPAAGDWRREVRRSRQLLAHSVEGVCGVVGHALACDVSDVYTARAASTALRQVVRQLFQVEGRIPEGRSVAAAQAVVDQIGDFTGLHPVSDLLTSQEIAEASAGIFSELWESQVPRDRVIAVAADAFDVAVAA